MKRMMAAAVGVCLSVGCGGTEDVGALHGSPSTASANGRRGGLESQRFKSRTGPITSHGGGVMLGAPNVYFVWYGNWSANSATAILPDLVSNLGGSAYFNITSSYADPSGARLGNALSYAGSGSDAYSRGTSLADADVQAVVSGAVGAGLPVDPNGIYLVLASADVNESSGLCKSYCSWHSHASIGGADLKYAFVGNPDRCPSACAPQTASPNGNSGADAMANLVAHEIEDSVTDPGLNAWYDAQGLESADKCSWTFGATHPGANGSQVNVKLGQRDYLLQQNWANASAGYCALSY